MCVIGHGLDVVDCKRIETMLQRHPDRFLERVLTPNEREDLSCLKHPLQRIAGRFAAKEAILKMLGTGWAGRISWQDMEIRNDRAGRPVVSLAGECDRVAADLGIGRVMLSITHTDHYAAASVIGVSE